MPIAEYLLSFSYNKERKFPRYIWLWFI